MKPYLPILALSMGAAAPVLAAETPVPPPAQATAPLSPGEQRAADFKATPWDISHAGTPLSMDGYKLTFEDNFDSLQVTPDGGKGAWFAPIHSDFGAAHLLPPGPDGPFSVKDGILTIRAQKNEKGKWTSGLMQTVDSKGQGYVQQYGYFEMRAQMPVGPGSWAAFWLLSQNGFTDYTKTRTEIDIVEWYGSDARGHHATVHLWPGREHQPDSPPKALHKSQYSNLNRWQERFKLPENPMQDGQLVGWHTYGAEITPELVTIYFDGHELCRFPTQPEYKTPLYMLVNLDINGKEADKAVSPLEMKVDYVRAYTKR
jgi:hypothetical protein